MDSNHHLQNRNLVCYHYTMVQYIVAPEGVEPSLTEPKPVVLPLYYRALSVEPRGVEPRSEDFQSSAYTKSAKVPYVVAPDGFELPTPTFVASYSNPTELTSLVSSIWVQRYNRQMKPFFVAEKSLIYFVFFGFYCYFCIRKSIKSD